MKTIKRVQQDCATKTAKSQAKIQPLSAPAEFKIVRLRECPVKNPKIDVPQEVADFWREHVVSAPWYKDEKECFCVFLLNTRRRLIGFDLVSQGTLDTVLAPPREVLRLATVQNAAAIIVAHNHPSGDPSPSEADIKVTRGLIRAAGVLQIPLLDHIIIGAARRKNSFVSLRERGYFLTSDSAPLPEFPSADSAELDALVVLDKARNQSVALHQLMLDSETHRLMKGDHNASDRSQVNAGVAELVSITNTMLNDAFDSFSAIHPKREGVAPRTKGNPNHKLNDKGMKTSNPARKASSAAPSARQVKTPPGKTVTVVFYSSDDGSEFCRLDIPEIVFAAIKRATKKLGVSLDVFFELAVRDKIKRDESVVAAASAAA
jgi:DNA repair protein RadC